jgi:hypothetical protein
MLLLRAKKRFPRAQVKPKKAKERNTMRFLIKASMPNDAGNAAISDGSLGKTIQSILGDLKPEAAYFLAENGQRTAYVFVNMQDASQIPALAEPWFLAFNATVELIPVMVPEDLGKAEPAIQSAVKKYSKKS